MDEKDVTLLAILKRHPRITFCAGLALIVIVGWPVLDYVWHRFVLGF